MSSLTEGSEQVPQSSSAYSDEDLIKLGKEAIAKKERARDKAKQTALFTKGFTSARKRVNSAKLQIQKSTRKYIQAMAKCRLEAFRLNREARKTRFHVPRSDMQVTSHIHFVNDIRGLDELDEAGLEHFLSDDTNKENVDPNEEEDEEDEEEEEEAEGQE
jgi:hypothetical protein